MGRKLLLTGGTGSFGMKFAEIALKECDYEVIRVYSRSEYLQSEMAQKFEGNSRLRFLIGDVRDKTRLYRAMQGIDIVIHAAAIKQIPTAEYNPIEAVRTNIDGAINVIDAAIDTGIERVMAISTDKAAHPCNLYGTTKSVAEKLFVQANVYTRKTIFSCVRYGNVMGSRGSVIPLFLKQRESGELTVTDPDMTRFWITLEQGVRFVLKRLDEMKGGEIFVPKLPSMKMSDMANFIAPDAKIKIVGLRPGEKLHEEMVTEEERYHTREFSDYFAISPEFPFWTDDTVDRSEVKRYSSDNNGWWLTKEELLKYIGGI
ncbi:hypothetical protein LCGC14_0969270 [marine sediment metagenome]|uniref:Polysaccharide biosynthesis protein CapD-like domain-containing protein n=1 Tax=marine sediment metagenome TaxID=412755 RepID=A0A0F9NC76_9ZZZZ